ncbi:FAD-binding oxidoreductase, partial [Nocardiopsis tropica]|nr:FAD-binding oxidoreductase [Nocardiopsis tropica]
PDDLATFDLFRRSFDPDGIANPDKLLPTPRLCGERPGVRRGVHPLVESGRADQF